MMDIAVSSSSASSDVSQDFIQVTDFDGHSAIVLLLSRSQTSSSHLRMFHAHRVLIFPVRSDCNIHIIPLLLLPLLR